jgi:hypothetical protein
LKPDCAHEPGTHCIHSSERRAFRGCRRRWDWAYRNHYSPPNPAKPLEIGIAFHKAMEQIYEPTLWETTSDNDKLSRAIRIYSETCEEQRLHFLKVTGQTNRNFTEVHGDDYAARIELGKGMLIHYMQEVHPLADTWFKPVEVEVPFSVPLTYPDTRKAGDRVGQTMSCSNSPLCGQAHPNPAPITLNGRVDALLEDQFNGGYFVADWKSAAQLIRDGEFLQLDDQITSYCAALQLILNLDVRGFMYAEFKKAFPQAPRRLDKPRKGCHYSVSHTQETTYEVAKETFSEGDPFAFQQGLYDEYLAWLQSPEAPRYHQRFPVIQSDAKLENVLTNVSMEAMDITDPDLLVYPSPSKMNCSGCAFKTPCLGKFNNDDYLYTLESLYDKPITPK